MPKLKQINCSIELGPSNTKLKEYGARYSDGHVEAFIAVPDTEIPFTVHLKSNGYIAPGLAFFVFMDGEYQCNRNRVCLKLPAEGVQPSDYETEFRVRQKEEKTSFGTFVVRDWTFAKLNRVAADKAPSLNPQFTNNVGTIEVIVLRCKTDMDGNPPPKAVRAQIANKPTSAADAKRSSAAAPLASVKAATAQQSEIGGLFGLFDGSFDLDGAGDEQPVGPDGRVKPTPPPGMVWEPINGIWVPKHGLKPLRELNIPPSDPRIERDLEADIARKIKDIERGLEEARVQLDGHEGQPGVVINQWGGRARDDMRGDKYLDLQDQDRSAYKQYMRETGESVSSLTDDDPLPNRNPGLKALHEQDRARAREKAKYLSDGPPAGLPQYRMPAQPNPKQVFDDVKRIKANIMDFMQKNPDAPQDQAKRELSMLAHIQFLMMQGQGTLTNFPLWLKEVLTDVEIRQQHTLRAAQKYPHMDFAQVLGQLEKDREEALRDPIYHKDFDVLKVDDCLALSYMFHERAETFKQFLKGVERFSAEPVDEIRARMDFIYSQAERADDTVKELERQAQARNEARAAQGWNHDRAAQFQHGAQVCGDGANIIPPPRKGQEGWENAAARGDVRGGWQHIGENTWNPQKPTQPKRDGWFDEGHKATGRTADKEKLDDWKPWAPNKVGSQRQCLWTSDEKPQSKNAAGWGQDENDAWGQNDPGDAWKKSSSRKTHEHDFSNRSNHSQSSRWKDESQKKSSSHRSSWDKTWNNDRGGNQAWAETTGNNNGGNLAWSRITGSKNGGGDAWVDVQEKSKSKSPSVHTAIRVQDEDPNAYIKPYWKDWNRPFSRSESSDPKTEKKRDEPREVYNYPASTLPAVPEKEAKGASHGIQMSSGTDYSHKCRKPIYIDTMEQPYAVFSFKYRSKEALEKILKFKIDEVDVKKVKEQAEKDRLLSMPKHRLIEELMDKRAPGKSSSGKSATNGAGREGSGWSTKGGSKKSTAGWGDKDGDEKQGSRWSSQGDGNKSGSDWKKRGNGDSAANGWDNNNDNAWGNPDKQSNHSDRTVSNRWSSKSKSSQKNDLDGWNNELTNAPLNLGSKKKSGTKPGWDDSPASRGGWDGNNEAESVFRVYNGFSNLLRDEYDVSKVQKKVDQLRFTTPDFPGARHPSALQKPKATFANEAVEIERAASTLEHQVAENDEWYGGEYDDDEYEEDSDLFRYNYSDHGYDD